ncbi:hypothetical protein EBF04_23880 [Streptomyces sp. I6]|nr:hypothetical protein EBF04_23880 [Streptomyces sp. I6]
MLGYRRDGRPIYPVLGASSADPSNDDATLTLSQKQLNTLLAREKDQGGRAAVRALVGLGQVHSSVACPFDRVCR